MKKSFLCVLFAIVFAFGIAFSALNGAFAETEGNSLPSSGDEPVKEWHISFDSRGGSSVPEKTVLYSDKILENVEPPTRLHFAFKGWYFEGVAVTEETKISDLEIGDLSRIELVAAWRDIVAPEGMITLRGYNWIDFTAPLTYEWYCSETQTVTVTAYDNGTVEMIGYIISSQDMSVADLENAVYASYEEPIVLDENGEYIIYVMIVDGGMNIRYIRSDRIIIDKTAPVINGIEDGRIYCSGQTFTVTEEYLYGVFVNNEEIKPENGVYTLPFGKSSIVVYDEAGNRTTADVTVYDGHTPGLNLGDCTVPVYCVYCNETAIEAGEHDFKWVTDREATEDETGEKHEECSVCGTKRNEGTEIPKKGKTPPTSDAESLAAWIAAAAVSSLGLAGLYIFARKRVF